MAKMSESNNQVEMFACANCGLEVRTKHSEFVEGTNCPKCKKPLFLVGQKNNMNLKINVEVSGALKGLKAVQREARKATAALKELDNLINNDEEITVTVDGRTIAKFVHDVND